VEWRYLVRIKKLMVKTLIVTDIHLSNARSGYLDEQVACLHRIHDHEKPDDLIIMGDIFMHRRPTPSVLLGLRRLLAGFNCRVWLLRGNHDSETKSDNGITALSLFADDGKVKVITHTRTIGGWTFIPHYENEETIKAALAEVPEGNTVFGHFGYNGCLNSTGDHDFNIDLSCFTNRTFLGHIHRFNDRTFENSEGVVTNVTILGTPYSINFGDSGRHFYYAIQENSSEWEYKKIDHGLRHIVCDLEDVPSRLDEINHPDHFVHLRVFVDKLDDTNSFSLVDDIKSVCNVQQVDIKFRPIVDADTSFSNYNPERSLFAINEAIVDEYVEESGASISKEDLMEGYRLLNED